MIEYTRGIPRGVLVDAAEAAWEYSGGRLFMYYYGKIGAPMALEMKVYPAIIPWEDESEENEA